ncbi:polyphenol oxidase I, chloroplastic-like [Humulus lupulus]|uniref:polyphenol oxidase I, chloroplastic-like n=1 Tax=Humulus lupulus TaxID=3486 RepID=UPI002B410B14|nr:polyphenol oxidase I, chloroplastic-like [Humulus lupulus]
MATGKYSCLLLLAFVAVAVLPVTLLFLSFTSISHIWEIEGTILNYLLRSHSRIPSNNNNVTNFDKANIVNEISPNLTTCHDSYGRPDLLVNCCPPLSGEASAVPIDFQYPLQPSTLRVRRSVHHLDSAYIAKYTKALAIMKSLPHSDPRSFTRQASIHCTFCTGAYDQKHSSATVNIHRQWLFFPFHRMYLYFHERILGSLIGDENFALPFWNWDNPESMVFPKMFHEGPFYDSQREPTHFDQIVDLNYDEEVGIVSRGEEQVNSNLAFMYNQVISSAKKPELFMGCPLYPGDDGFCDGPGTVELAPHNTVHTWVGLGSNPGQEHMGAFYSAGFDPCFYSHHANLDRIWDIWRDIHDMHMPINDTVWLKSHFYFYDENLQLVKIKVSDVLNITKLGYTYEKTDLTWLNKVPKPFVSPQIAKHKLKIRENYYKETSRQHLLRSKLEGRSLENPMTIKVSRPKPYRSKEEIKEEEEVLVVYGIKIKGDMKVKFDVYVNLVNETNVGPTYREFAGTFIRLPDVMMRSTTSEENQKSSMKLGISELLNDLEADRDESIWVTLLPRTTSCAKTTFDGVRIDYMR